MVTRTPAPDGKKTKDGQSIMVLPENTLLKKVYRLCYLTTGGMSVIYLATRDSDRYIVKEVDSKDVKGVMALTQEKAILERLDHPNIVKIYDFFEENGYCYLVMEYIEGVTMDRKVPIGSELFLAESLVRDWAFQLMDIFEFLHRQKPPVIYRDLKPKNIMIDKNGKLKLIDFGIARTYKHGKTFDTDHMGSMITASPEHYGGSQTDQRSDIFTLGATLHFVLTNGRCIDREPFDFPRVKLINPKITEQFDEVLQKALQMDPKDRYQSIAEMRFALRGCDIPFGEVCDGKSAVIQDTLSIDEARRTMEDESEKPERERKYVENSLPKKRELSNKVLVTLVGMIIGIILALGLLAIVNRSMAGSAVPWTEAKNYYGKEKTVVGKVEKVFFTAHGNIYLHFSERLENDFSVIIYKENHKKFMCYEDPESFFISKYRDRVVQVTGKISKKEIATFEVPSIYVDDPSQIVVK